MKLRSIALLGSLLIATAVGTGVLAQSWQFNTLEVSLKSGETTEIMDLYWVTNCVSLLTAPPEVTVMDAPPGITAAAEEAMVMPRIQQCAEKVKGAKLKVHAGVIDDLSNTIMNLRVKFHTKDGDRERSLSIKLSLFP